jgi:two-component system phosphate regulon sensor histidine kinase PhoR
MYINGMIKVKKIKTFSIREVTWLITILMTLASILAVILHSSTDSTKLRVLALIGILLLNFLIIRFFVENYIFHKIKVIYKMISETKREKSGKDSRQDNIEYIQNQVQEWAESTREEISSLKSLEEYRKNFVGNISHELKTPIFTIQGYLHTLLDGGLSDPNVNVDFLKRAVDNTDRLQNIVEDLEVIARLESGKSSLEPSNFSIKELCNMVMADLESMAEPKMISLKFKENSVKNLIVNADKEAIRQVLTNLIVNSIKYGREGGITKIGIYDLGDDVLIEISDNGIGISEEHHKHLFDRFYRVDPSRSRKQGGSGLGLSIVKHIIEAHNQTISVRSTPNEGSTFGFTLSKSKA